MFVEAATCKTEGQLDTIEIVKETIWNNELNLHSTELKVK
jgi:hypothetical protein